MDTNESDDERKPLLNTREVRQLIDQAKRLNQEERNLIAQAGN